MNTKKSLGRPGEADPRGRSLSSVAKGAMDEPTRMRGRPPIQPVKGQRRGKGRGKPWTNIRALAREYSAEAMGTLAKLMHSDNDCVSFGAARTVIERGHGREPVLHQSAAKGPSPENRDLR